MVISMSLVVGVAQAFSFPAYSALIPTLVDRRHLGNAIALNSTQFNLSRVLGPAIAGVVMAGLGSGWCFALNALSFLALIYAVSVIRVAATERPKDAEISFRAGLKAIFGDRDLAALILVIFFSSLFSGPLLTFIPVIARDVYHVGASGFGALLSIFGLGALTGAILIASFNPGNQAGVKVVMAGAAGAALSIIATAYVPSIRLGAVLIFATGLFFIICNAVANTRLQSGVPDHLRGRAASLFILSFRGAMPLGNLISGVTVEKWGVSRALALNGALALLSLFAIALLLRKPSEPPNAAPA
jgi:predicted MFS family arabinose efflux permease